MPNSCSCVKRALVRSSERLSFCRGGNYLIFHR
jgi:hypothetical protein